MHSKTVVKLTIKLGLASLSLPAVLAIINAVTR
jgi:hypothetical protein